MAAVAGKKGRLMLFNLRHLLMVELGKSIMEVNGIQQAKNSMRMYKPKEEYKSSHLCTEICLELSWIMLIKQVLTTKADLISGL